MKEATGELNITVISLVAISAVAALFYFIIWPILQRQLIQNTCETYGSNYHAVKGDEPLDGNDKVSVWQCCPGEESFGGSGCITAN